MLTIKYETTFKKDFKRVVKRGYNIKLMETVIELLANEQPLPQKYKDHSLSGDYSDCRRGDLSDHIGYLPPVYLTACRDHRRRVGGGFCRGRRHHGRGGKGSQDHREGFRTVLQIYP